MDIRKVPSTVTPRFTAAVEYAARLHGKQRKKGTSIPYIAHLLAVASLVLEFGGDRDEAVAALLHDAIEDGENPVRVRRQIAERFGKRVLAIVEGCTDTDVKPKPKWWPRKEAYLAHFAEVPRSVALVAAADKLHNLRSILADYRQLGRKLWPRFKGRRDGTLWYYRSLVELIQTRRDVPPTLARELSETLAALEHEVQLLEHTSTTSSMPPSRRSDAPVAIGEVDSGSFQMRT